MTETILKYIQSYTEKHGYEPEIVQIHKDTGILRKYIYDAFEELRKTGQIEDLKPKRSAQYRLK